MYEKLFAEPYVKIYAYFHESKVVLEISHGQNTFFSRETTSH